MSRSVGSFFEKKAGEYLENKGYSIILYNYTNPFGEIDLIAQDGETLVFVEVKYRDIRNSADAYTFVDSKKMRKFKRTVMEYFYDFPSKCPFRLDVIAIEKRSDNIYIEHFENITM